MSRTILMELEEKASRDEKETYLVKLFIVDLLSGADSFLMKGV